MIFMNIHDIQVGTIPRWAGGTPRPGMRFPVTGCRSPLRPFLEVNILLLLPQRQSEIRFGSTTAQTLRICCRAKASATNHLRNGCHRPDVFRVDACPETREDFGAGILGTLGRDKQSGRSSARERSQQQEQGAHWKGL